LTPPVQLKKKKKSRRAPAAGSHLHSKGPLQQDQSEPHIFLIAAEMHVALLVVIPEGNPLFVFAILKRIAVTTWSNHVSSNP
jgi:hypothetical protein